MSFHGGCSSAQPVVDKFLALLRRCVSTKTLQQVHSQMLVNSLDKHNFLLPKLVDVKDFNYASLFFSHIPKPNEYTYNIMIRGLTTTWKKYDIALNLYYKMKILGLKPDNFTYPFLFISCANLLALDHGRLAHSMILRCGLNFDDHTSHSLITMYAQCGDVGYARQVFDEITEKDLVSWNSMIAGYSKMGFAGDAVDLFQKMKDEGFHPNEMTLVSVLGACGDLGDLNMGRSLECFVEENNIAVNSYIGSALISMFSKSGDVSSAKRVFDEMKKKDVITWNAMITGYAQNGLSNEAIQLFNSMKTAGLKPNKITLVGVLSACASIGSLELGKYICAYASENGLLNEVYVATALIDMYAKCGSVDDAFAIFQTMPEKNKVSWNAMISALAFHGRAEESLSLFTRMEKEGRVSPDDITFVAVLSACVHAGLVNEGKRLFNLMSTSFGLVPKVEHYSCMVDLLARSGRLNEAWDLIGKMPGKPDEVLLGALLGACQKFKNTDVGEKAMKLLLTIEASNSGNYIISSKMYANLRRWDDSAKMRVLMKEQGVAKTPGCSWIEVDGRLHEFHAGICFNSLYSEEIYKVIELLIDEMKIEGYNPNVSLL
ncbi:pentatricopeptide repeat-containing protein At2g34400 [Impatiens glandulifera]|uniref:pentatricopeptide repeat-containing protein At2g34400 n=1 Tax=Impatiens glandulifera TaxID=253017 RepID=UPI001FB0A056|nr:pentatricopeptide repeat-containing protein At2g34400 [Impatiens glandulifera]